MGQENGKSLEKVATCEEKSLEKVVRWKTTIFEKGSEEEKNIEKRVFAKR